MKTTIQFYNWPILILMCIVILITFVLMYVIRLSTFNLLIICSIELLVLIFLSFSYKCMKFCRNEIIISHPFFPVIDKIHISITAVKQIIYCKPARGTYIDIYTTKRYRLSDFYLNKYKTYQLIIVLLNAGYNVKISGFLYNTIEDIRPRQIKISHYIFIIFLSSITITFFGYFLFIRKTNDIELTKILIILLLTALVCSLISVIHYYIRHKQIIKFNKHFDK